MYTLTDVQNLITANIPKIYNSDLFYKSLIENHIPAYSLMSPEIREISNLT